MTKESQRASDNEPSCDADFNDYCCCCTLVPNNSGPHEAWTMDDRQVAERSGLSEVAKERQLLGRSVWITTFWRDYGIREGKVSAVSDDPGIVVVGRGLSAERVGFGDWHLELEAAMAKIETYRASAIADLYRQIAELTEFEPKVTLETK